MDKLEAVIFDFDGTLVPTITRQYDWFNYWAQKHDKQLIYSEKNELLETPAKFMDFYNHFMHLGGPQKVYDELELPCDMNDKKHPVWEAYTNFKLENPLQLYEGMKQVLNELHSKGIKLAINTTNTFESIEKELDKENVKHYFNPIVTEEYLAKFHGAGNPDAIKKPSKISLSLTLNELNVNGNNVLHIGDTLNDLISSKKVMRQNPTRFEDLTVIGVSWGFEGREKLEEGYKNDEETTYFDFIIDKPQELLPIINSFL